MVLADLGKAFGKSGVWGVFMLSILGFIGWPMLGFGSARYIGVGGQAQAAAGASY
jgi:hypothetical protein